jgi:methyltransferase
MELTFKAIIIFTIIQRLYELKIAKANEKTIVAKGGQVLPEKNYIFMVLLHTSWLASLVYFAFLSELQFSPILFGGALFFFITGQCLRILAIRTLGERWSTRVMVLPEAPVIKSGLFNIIRHPNYLGVVLEIAALPLMAGLWPHALVFSLLNGLILFFRIRFEEEMLGQFNNYRESFKIPTEMKDQREGV